jgi:hypothetical protein
MCTHLPYLRVVNETLNYKGKRQLESVEWHAGLPTTPVRHPYAQHNANHRPESSAQKSVDAARLSQWIEMLLANSLVTFNNTVYHQIIGLPMGTNCAPALTNIYLYYYELNYMLRRIDAYRANPSPLTWLDAYVSATLSRYIDDLLAFNAPGGLASISYDTRQADGSGNDGLYPTSLPGPTGAVIQYPLTLNITDEGTAAPMMDLRIGQQYIPTQGRYRFNFSVYYKFRSKPNLMKLHKGFPHIKSALAQKHKYNVIISQLCRFADLCSSVHLFKQSMRSLVHKMLADGYNKHHIRHILSSKGFKKMRRSNVHDLPRVEYNTWISIVIDIMRT